MATEELEPPHRASLPALRGDIVLRHVWFEYDRSVPVLKDISLHAAPGTTTAFVGASGSGKSTLLGLLMAFHQPTAGSLLVDGHDLAHLGLASYRRHIGVVLQESFLFDGTIAENLRYARPRASDEEVRAAARAAYCDEFIDAMAEGYETVVGERGVRLSSGQRQRLAIARAILVNPRLLMLDEATSSLDAHSEARIQEALRALRRGRTTFVIAHRLSTVRHADQICVLDHGRIVEQGTHASLHALGGAYRSLYEQQGERLAERFINPGEEYAREWGRP
jgi:subfamily B ATP-binding cassette protein MsbA